MTCKTFTRPVLTFDNLPNRTEVRFGELVELAGSPKLACDLLDELLEGGYATPALQQPWAKDDEGVWDGGFEYVDGQTYYVGCEGPCGFGETVRVAVHYGDVIDL